jgi:hypothetical protein
VALRGQTDQDLAPVVGVPETLHRAPASL